MYVVGWDDIRDLVALSGWELYLSSEILVAIMTWLSEHEEFVIKTYLKKIVILSNATDGSNWKRSKMIDRERGALRVMVISSKEKNTKTQVQNPGWVCLHFTYR